MLIWIIELMGEDSIFVENMEFAGKQVSLFCLEALQPLRQLP